MLEKEENEVSNASAQKLGGYFHYHFNQYPPSPLCLKGVVQTPMHRGQTLFKTPLYESWAAVHTPSGYMMMISMPAPERMTAKLMLYAGDRGNKTLASYSPWIRTDHTPTVYNTTLILFHLITNAKDPGFNGLPSLPQAGFQIDFSLHNVSALPEKLPNNLWNCSVPYVSDFLFHLSCNIQVECQDAMDETDCSYTTERCGPGLLTLGGGCFFYLWTWDKEMNWREASDECLQRGASLAILNTVDKWKDAIRLLPFNKLGLISITLGITTGPNIQPLWYRTTNRWTDETTAFYVMAEINLYFDCQQGCGFVTIQSKSGTKEAILMLNPCYEKIPTNMLCEIPRPFESTHSAVLVNGTDHWPRDTAYVECPLGHYTHQFLACDAQSSCLYDDVSQTCEPSQAALGLLESTFSCTKHMEHVPYTLVCNHRTDCADGSDEDFCSFPRCRTGQFSCDDKQCIPSTNRCDGWGDCLHGEDEQNCVDGFQESLTPPPPAYVSLSHDGLFQIQPKEQGDDLMCANTHFQCNGYCLPVILRCNHVYDCPGHEDEAGCDMCPGYYRCRTSQVCLNYGDLCDGHAHCPQHDDELLCDSTCPSACVCRGMAFFCRYNFTASDYPLLRFLDVRSSTMTPAQLAYNMLLIHLTLANCSLSRLDGLGFPNMLSLNVQDNKLETLNHTQLLGVPQLRSLSVAGNPLNLVFKGSERFLSFHDLLSLDLSRVILHQLNVTTLTIFPRLRILNLSQTEVWRVHGEGFRDLDQLRVLDLRGCPVMWFPRGMFQGLRKLQVIYADNFKVCCPKVLPLTFNMHNCIAPSNEISSCDNLLRRNEYRISLFLLSAVALVGNAASFIFRTFVSKREHKIGHGNFVTHLSVSDFLMGVYLAVIGIADQTYRDTYLWNDLAWRHSGTCKFAGFLSLLSSEVSALIMCLITIDRFLVLGFPFSRLHFSLKSAHIASFIVWLVGVVLVSVPLLPVASHWEVYSQTGICIPLPTKRADFSGYDYTFGILIIFNCVVFVVISLGQLSIYWSIRANSMSVSNTTKKTKDLAIARRLISVAMTDFLCWFPVGVLGLMSFNDIPIPGEINVAIAVFILPLNSAVNPCLYTLNVILERRSRAREEKLRKLLLMQLKSNN